MFGNVILKVEPLGSGQLVFRCFVTAKQACLPSDFRVWVMGSCLWMSFLRDGGQPDSGLFEAP